MPRQEESQTGMGSLTSFQDQLLRAIGEAVIATDSSGRVTFWNPAAEALYGWSAAEATGRPIVELASADWSRGEADAILQRLLKGEAWSGELACRHKDGKILNVHIRATPIRDEAGMVVGVVGVSHDVAERGRTRQAVRDNEARFQLAARASRDVIWDWDVASGRIWRSASLLEQFGCPVAQEHGLDGWVAHVHPDDRTKVRRAMAQALDGAAPSWSLEYRMRRNDGTYAEVLDRAHILRGGDGRPQRVLGALTDVTQSREAERELMMARRALVQTEKLTALGMLVGGVGHEIRTPLAYMATNLYLLRSRLERAAESGQDARSAVDAALPHLDEAMQGVDRINRLVLELRRFQKAPPKQRAAMSLHEPAAAALALFRATAGGRASVEAHLEPTPPLPMDDPQLQQVVLNLLDNAADAAPNGVIELETRATEKEVQLVVRDRGDGIAPALLPRILEGFFTTKPHGTGLGLAIVQRIVHEHGGTLRLESAPGEGTTVYVSFPREGLRS